MSHVAMCVCVCVYFITTYFCKGGVCVFVCVCTYVSIYGMCVHPLFVCLSVCVCAAGVVFDSLEGEDLEYTLRLRHEVGGMDTWHTHEAAFWLQAPGARVTDK